VIIIGAGPAGLSCAIELQKSGKTVLLVDKKKHIGPKVCAGGLTTKIKDLGIPLETAEILFSKALVSVSDKTLPILNKTPFVGTIDRGRLGDFLLNKLEDKITVSKGCEVSQIGEGFIVANKKKIEYKYLVGADGSNSMVRKFLGLETKKFLLAIQYLIHTRNNNLEICFDTDFFGPGYGWVFPHKGYASVGCCQDIRYFGGSRLRKGFDKWLAKKKIDVSNVTLEGWTINFDYQGFEFGNKFLVGDAGGFASGLTGEGIYFGLISGKDVARRIINPEYKCKGIEQILKVKIYHENTLATVRFLIKIFKGSSNYLFKFLFGFMKNKRIQKKLIKRFV